MQGRACGSEFLPTTGVWDVPCGQAECRRARCGSTFCPATRTPWLSPLQNAIATQVPLPPNFHALIIAVRCWPLASLTHLHSSSEETPPEYAHDHPESLCLPLLIDINGFPFRACTGAEHSHVNGARGGK